jgi:hypothetical protein
LQDSLKNSFEASRKLYCVFIKTIFLAIQKLGLVQTLFKGEKTYLFWAGLLTLGFASVLLFQTVWSLRHYAVLSRGLEVYFPGIVGSIVFILIGLYMMKSGIKRNQPPPES